MKSCPECGESFSRITAHWQHNPEHRPTLSEKQHETVTGLIMGDGGVYKKGNSAYPTLMVSSVTKPFLEHLEEIFGIFSSSLYLNESAEEMKERQSKRDNTIANTASGDNYRDVWMFSTSAIPELSEYREWYDSGSKIWPRDIKMSKRVLKYWYAGDGCYEKNHNRIRIAMNNERDHKSKVSSYFSNSGLPEPNWNASEDSFSAYWSKDESEKLLDYMGDPVPGFEYKWSGE